MEAPFDTTRFNDDLQIDRMDLSNAFANQASLFAYYAERHAVMLRQEARMKLKVEIARAKAYRAIRDEAVANKEKKTEGQIEAEVLRNTEYITSVFHHNEAKSLLALAHSAMEAFKQRRDMLVQLGASEREELKGDLAMRSRQDRETGMARVRERLHAEQEAAATS
jgi:hypothetical protein